MILTKYYYNLNMQNQKYFKDIEEDREELKNTGEDYIINRIENFKLNCINNTCLYKKDDGVDFIIKYKDTYFVSQIKYWLTKAITYKEVKQFFGEMELSKISRNLRNEKVRYLLLCPYVSDKNKNEILQIEKEMEKYNILFGNKFIEFIVNPTFTMEEIIMEDN